MSEGSEARGEGRGEPGLSRANRTLLNAQDIGKSYFMGKRSLEVLRHVNLTVARGDFLTVRGASGAGKSTLLHLLGGLDTPTSGEIRFDGKNPATLSGLELARLRNRKVGFVFQAYHLLPELSALENVCLPARPADWAASIRARRAGRQTLDRKSTRLNSSHRCISYAVFCLQKKQH